MKFIDLVKENKQHISFENISEPRIKGAALQIIVHASDNETDLLIFTHSAVTRYQLDFPSYVSYSVTADDYTSINASEKYSGESFRIYSESDYLDYIQNKSTLKREFFGKTLTHFALLGIEHSVDILSFAEPTITATQIDSNQS